MTNLNLIPSWTLRLVYLLTRDVQPRNVSDHRHAVRHPMPLWARAHRSDGTIECVLCVAQLHFGTSTRSGHGILRLGARQGHREIRVHIDAWGVEPAHEKVLQWIQEVAGITDRDVLRQFYELFTAARRPAPHTQLPSVTQKRKHAAAVAELPSDAGSSRSAADAPEASESASQPAVLQSGSSTAPFGDGISCRYRRCPPAIARTCVAGPHHILRARPVASLQQRDVQLLSDRVPHPPSRILPERDVQEGNRLRHGDVAHASQLLRNGRNA